MLPDASRVLPDARVVLPGEPRCTQFSTPRCFRVHAVCSRKHLAVLNSVHQGASGCTTCASGCIAGASGCMRSAPGSTSLYSIQYTRVLPGASRVLPYLRVLHPNVYGESTEAQGVSPSVHTVLRALQVLTARPCVALSTGQTALRGQSAFHRPRSARGHFLLHAAVRLYLLHDAGEHGGHLVERVDDADFEGGGGLAGGAGAVVTGPSSAAVVLVERMAAGAGVFRQLHVCSPLPSFPNVSTLTAEESVDSK